MLALVFPVLSFVAAAMMFFQPDTSGGDNGGAAAGIAGLGLSLVMIGVALVISLVSLLIQIFLAWKVATKCGYSGVMSLLLLIPIVNIIVIIMWVFAKWPIEAEVERLGGTLPIHPPAKVQTG